MDTARCARPIDIIAPSATEILDIDAHVADALREHDVTFDNPTATWPKRRKS
jgi:hypothetical protein